MEIFSRWRSEPFKIYIFVLSLAAYLIATQYLVVENSRGIFFDLEPFPNMAAISYFILFESIIIYLFDTLVTWKTSFRDVMSYVGFASIIPWLSPAIIEGLILIRWTIDGSFEARTAGKGIGAAHLNDILFIYGFRNFVFSFAIFYSTMILLSFSNNMIKQGEKELQKSILAEEQRNWLINAWENPLTLLSESEQSNFLENHKNLDEVQQKDLLRRKILPDKGIILVDPNTNS
jgi:hypothetical protein